MNIKLLTLISALSFLASTNAWAQSEVTQEREAAANKIAAARFDLEDMAIGECEIVGRLSIRRQFHGKRVKPAFADVVRFHSFAGTEFKFLKFADDELKNRLLKQLMNGLGIPVIISADLESMRVGHDGINMSTRIIGTVDSCEILTPKVVAIAAATKGFEAEDIQRFKAALKPDAISNHVAVSLGSIYVRSKASRRGSGVSVSNIRVFNPLSDPVSIAITGLQIEQNGVMQKCTLAESSRPGHWEIEAESWADGIYEEGKTPKRMWTFEPADLIEPEQDVTLHLEMKINGEVVTLKRTSTPK